MTRSDLIRKTRALDNLFAITMGDPAFVQRTVGPKLAKIADRLAKEIAESKELTSEERDHGFESVANFVRVADMLAGA